MLDTSITAARVHTSGGWLGPTSVHIANGVITGLVELSGDSADTAPERILVPGFVDVQVNGIDDVDVAAADGDDWRRLDRLLLEQGVTSWCPTLVTSPLDRYQRPLERIAAAMDRPSAGRPRIIGVHLEGPFLGAAHGAHRAEFVIGYDHDWLDALPAHIALMTVGPELVGSPAAIAALRSQGIVVSIGHTRASLDEFDAGVAAGAQLVTHLFNAMSGVHHRDPGVAAFAMTTPGLHASLIADGVHVHPRMIRLAFEAMRERLILVTDAVAWRAGRIGPIGLELRDGAPRLPDGTLAGSALTMDAAIRMCVEEAGIDLHDAISAASAAPARLMGLTSMGRIEIGARADLVTLDADLRVEQTWIAGCPTL